jgi:D-serine dehydratase
MQDRLAGVYTVGDDDLFRWVALAFNCLKMQLEPSAAIGFGGPHFLLNTEQGRTFCKTHIAPSAMANAVHVVWTTGGSFVPDLKFQDFVDRGDALDLESELMKDVGF